jgi:hypothetical protein
MRNYFKLFVFRRIRFLSFQISLDFTPTHPLKFVRALFSESFLSYSGRVCLQCKKNVFFRGQKRVLSTEIKTLGLHLSFCLNSFTTSLEAEKLKLCISYIKSMYKLT